MLTIMRKLLAYLLRIDNLDRIMVFVTSLGNAGWFWIVLGLGLMISKKYRKGGILVLGALIFSALFGNIILKPLVARPRPCWVRDTVQLLVFIFGVGLWQQVKIASDRSSAGLFVSFGTHTGVFCRSIRIDADK